MSKVQDLDFYLFLIENVYEFIFINCLVFLALYLLLKKTLVAGVFDPIFLIFVIGFSTNYAVIIFLFLNSLISIYLFIMTMSYVAVFILVFSLVSNVSKTQSIFINYMSSISGKYEFGLLLGLYCLISIFILSQIGSGLFAESNRFENNRGFGAFVRLLDLFSVFITAYATLLILKIKIKYKRWFFWFVLGVFVSFSAFLNGAKISIIFSFITIVLVQIIHGYRLRISFHKILVIVLSGFSFMLLALTINLNMNKVNIDSQSSQIEGVPFVVDRLLHRLIANANTSYLLLPNDVIHQIKTDSVFVRFITPVIGVTTMNRLMGYSVNDYSVGRQALLFHSPNQEVAGGPTSHFDLFSYVYFGLFGGGVFVGFLAFLLGSINRLMRFYIKKHRQSNIFLSALLATIWVRGGIVIVAPTIGLAYLLDVLIVFSCLLLFTAMMRAVCTEKKKG